MGNLKNEGRSILASVEFEKRFVDTGGVPVAGAAIVVIAVIFNLSESSICLHFEPIIGVPPHFVGRLLIACIAFYLR